VVVVNAHTQDQIEATREGGQSLKAGRLVEDGEGRDEAGEGFVLEAIGSMGLEAEYEAGLASSEAEQGVAVVAADIADHGVFQGG
jgi:hypothetical protein